MYILNRSFRLSTLQWIIVIVVWTDGNNRWWVSKSSVLRMIVDEKIKRKSGEACKLPRILIRSRIYTFGLGVLIPAAEITGLAFA